MNRNYKTLLVLLLLFLTFHKIKGFDSMLRYENFFISTGAIEEDSDLSEVSAEKMLFNYIYYGDWFSQQNYPAFNFFDHDSGFFAMDASSADSEASEFEKNDKLDFYFFDGQYLDQKYALLKLNDTVDKFWNVSNGTFNYEASMNISTGSTTSSYSHEDSCTASIRLYYIDMNNGNTVFNSSKQKIDDLGIQAQITSEECNISSISNIMSIYSTFTSESQIFEYFIIMGLCLIVEVVSCLYLLKKYSQDTIKARRISLGTLWMFIIFDLNLSLLNLSYSVQLSGLTILLAIGFFIVAIILEAKIVSQVLNGIRETNYQSLARLSQNMCIWMSVLAFCIFITIYTNTMIVLFYIYALYPLPQIIDNIATKKRYRFNWMIFVCLGFPKLGYTLYISLDSNNMFRQTPQPTSALILCILIAIQLGILLLQRFYPKLCWEKKAFNYKLDAKKESLALDAVCPICMDNLIPGNEDTSGDTIINTPAPKNSHNLKADPLMKTPCAHCYHEKCLREWMKKKLECPTCRKAIPCLEDDCE